MDQSKASRGEALTCGAQVYNEAPALLRRAGSVSELTQLGYVTTLDAGTIVLTDCCFGAIHRGVP